MPILRKTKILATLGPASDTADIIESLIQAGADAFRLNFSHGTHQDHAQRYAIIRQAEIIFDRPLCVLADLQGPKLRVDRFEGDGVTLSPGQVFTFDLNVTPGNQHRAYLPHPEIFKAIQVGHRILMNDGKIQAQVTAVGKDTFETRIIHGGPLSNNKGVNVPDTSLPLSAMTDKDRQDLKYALDLGVDWVALSFVQRIEDVQEAKDMIDGRARLMVKIEKPQALDDIEAIVTAADGVMVARGDLGVEMPLEQVPAIQKRLVRLCRQMGKPVVVATQMLESMIQSPSPTRAEVSDVATAVYDGADAVMLSAESASGAYPIDAVFMMHRVIESVEADPYHTVMLKANYHPPLPTSDDAICDGVVGVARTIHAAAIVTYTQSGRTTLRTVRGRPESPVVALTPHQEVARQLCLSWGVQAIRTPEFHDLALMDRTASHMVYEQGLAQADSLIVVTAGMPFYQSGTTNMLRIVKVEDHL